MDGLEEIGLGAERVLLEVPEPERLKSCFPPLRLACDCDCDVLDGVAEEEEDDDDDDSDDDA